jgi:hypothetical protein
MLKHYDARSKKDNSNVLRHTFEGESHGVLVCRSIAFENRWAEVI